MTAEGLYFFTGAAAVGRGLQRVSRGASGTTRGVLFRPDLTFPSEFTSEGYSSNTRWRGPK